MGELTVQSSLATSVTPRTDWFPSGLIPLETVQVDLDEWLAMKYNGRLQNLQLDDESDEGPTTHEFHCFDMNFPVLMTDGGESRVFVRPCYELLFEILVENIDQRVHHVAVTGNPGIGKSRFYAYCVLRLTQDPIPGRILVINCGSQFFVFQNNEFHRLTNEIEIQNYQHNKMVVRFIDGKSDELTTWLGVSILFSSPGYSDYRTFKKSISIAEYVMPPWTKKELLIAAKVHDTSTDAVQKRFKTFGGVARCVFSTNFQLNFDNVVQAVRSINPLLPFSLVNIGSEVQESKYSHRILHMLPNHTENHAYSGFFLEFASNTVTEMVYEEMKVYNEEALKKFLMAHARDNNSSSFRGIVFEFICHRLWFRCENMTLNGKMLSARNTKDWSMVIPASVDSCVFSSLGEIPQLQQGKPLYCQPQQKNFPCIDAIFWTGGICYLLQMTISNDHGIAHNAINEILDWCASLQCKYALVFVVPTDQIETFKRQQFLTGTKRACQRPSQRARDLEQFVVGVDILPTTQLGV
ncbi:Aste57867_23597 [Aphanomyces stellatus]|uniref:Aste57867_23597 protein n=1 Tax=Aphanomyces stellatus TaxID=120398 RepID=A0A485LN86_9STRA|nr:hypothetical protein As57867_023525 [Aphanomyces stellatus]VFU00242.1 Aste57867_23597 [Aphanomyces stellatus]